jgi:hypothetical protein
LGEEAKLSSLHDAGGEKPPADESPSEPSASWLPSSPGGAIAPPASHAYTPPRSPAYATPAAPEPAVESPPARSTDREPDPAPAPSRRSRQAGWQLLVTGVALVAIAGGIVVLQGGDDDSGGGGGGGGRSESLVFGQVAATSAGATARTDDDADLGARPLSVGDEVEVGWVVETTGDATASIDLAGGGVVRFDSDAHLTFIDLAADPGSGDPTGASLPAIEVGGGRVWLNPGDEAITVQVAGGTLETAGNPVALDCAPLCAVEAPAGGVSVVTRTGNEAAPAPGEVVSITSDHGFDVEFAEAPSEWAERNREADRADGLPDDPVDEAPGIRASASLGGNYGINLEVVSEPAGDAIPGPLRYPNGSSYTVDVVADATTCDGPPPCRVPLSGVDGGSGTAEVADGAVELSFAQKIDCYNRADTAVVRPDIGTTSVDLSLRVGEVDFEGGRWLVRTLQGDGTVAATLATRCNRGDVLGTSRSSVEAAVSRA